MKLRDDYVDIRDDYYFKMGYEDGKKGSTFWALISFTAGFVFAFELSKELLLNNRT
jgi:hypothetical protein